jgi:competence protein ComEC
VLARCPMLYAALAALASGAVAEWSRPAAMLAASLAAAVVMPRSVALAIVCLGFAVRLGLPDPEWPNLPPLRDVVAAPVFRAIPEPDASIAVGALFGGRGSLPRDVFDAFALTGTSHLLAVSGFNITIAAAGLGLALRPLGSRAAAAGTFFVAIALAVIAGFGPSVARAALMASVGTAGVLAGRPLAALNALSAAAWALLFVTPRAIGDAGFLMSVSATAGLLLGARPLEERLRGPRWIRAQLAATLAASCASLPIAAEIFGRVPLISPIVNVAVAPLIPPLMAAVGITATVGHVAEWLAAPAAIVAYLCARLLRAAVELCAGLPIATLSFPHAGFVLVLMYATGAGILWRARLGAVLAHIPTLLSRPGPSLRRLAVGCFVTTLAAGASQCLPRPAERIVALDVGQGDSFLIEAGGARLLVDGGPRADLLLRALGDALPFTERRIDVVALTHAHADHATGLLAVIDRYEVRVALEPRRLEDGPVADAWHQALARRGIPVRAVGRGDGLRFGGIALEILSPGPDLSDEFANLAMRLRAGSLTAVLLGDMTPRAQRSLLLRPDELRATVYVPPHHGAPTPHAEALVAAARPRVALLSVGRSNRYGHPAGETLRALAAVHLMRTDRDGTLEVAAHGGSIHCRVRATAFPGPWPGWVPGSSPCA